MPQFTYSVRDPLGKLQTDTLTAPSLEEAAGILKAQKYQIIKLKEKTAQPVTKISGRVSLVEKSNLCRYLATMINAGLPLIEAVATITHDTKNTSLKHILSDVQHNLQKGTSLSDTFAHYPQVFDQSFITIVRAGERSGTLQKSFQYLEEQLMASHQLSQKVKGALIYPAVIIATMLGVGAILVIFVVPQIAQVFLKTKLAIPRLTVLVLQAGLILKANLHFVGLILGLIILSIVVLLNTRHGKSILLQLLKHAPVVNKLLEKLDLARFSRTLATLMQSGVPITESLAVSTQTLTQKKFAAVVKDLDTDIKKGESLASILRRHGDTMPQMMISMVSTGEKTGTLDKVLFDVAKFYELELEDEVKNFTALLEPIIMLVIGIGVGGMVLSVIAPIYSLVASLQSTK